MIKDAHELDADAARVRGDAEGVRGGVPLAAEGHDAEQVGALIGAAYGRVGFQGGASVQVGEYTALPHGSIQPQTIREGTIIMIDDGCTVEGYQSDITRTFVLGKPTDKMRKVFDIVHQAQSAALKAAKPGVPLDAIDAAARERHRRRRLRSRLQVLLAPARTRHGHGRPRMAVPREEQHVRVGRNR